MAKIHPNPDSELKKPVEKSNADPKKNFALASSPRKPGVSFDDAGDYDRRNVSIEYYQHWGQILDEQTNNNSINRLWADDIFIFGRPWNLLTVLRITQLLIVNVFVFLLPWMTFVWEGLQQQPVWILILVVGAHCVLYLIEENTLFVLSAAKKQFQLYYAIGISVLFASLEIYCGLMFAVVYLNQFITSLLLFILSVIYLVDHWLQYAMNAQQSQIQPMNEVRFDNVIRTETSETRLNVGPQLVFPIPEDFSVPGDSIKPKEDEQNQI